MAIGGAFLGGGVEVVPAGSCKLELEILTEDRANLTATFTIKGTSTYTVTAGADGRAVYTVPSGQTYTVSVNTTGYDNLTSQTVVAESGTVRYVRFEAFLGRVKRSGDTMTGELLANGGLRSNFVRKLQSDGQNVAFVLFEETDTSNIASLNARKSTGTNTAIYPALKLYANSDGTYYATLSSNYIGWNDNSDKVLTIKMANSLPSLCHTTGNETWSGYKTFSSGTVKIDSEVSDIRTLPSSWRVANQIEFRDSTTNKNQIGLCRLDEDSTSRRFIIRSSHLVNGATVSSEITSVVKSDGTTYATAPATPSGATGNEIVTANWSIGKFVQKTGDTMTGNLTIHKWNPTFFTKGSNIVIGETGNDYEMLQYSMLDSKDNSVGFVRGTLKTDLISRTVLSAISKSSGGNAIYSSITAIAEPSGVTYATAPSWSVGTNDNSDKILTIKMANSLPSLCHTSGNETWNGTKTLTKELFIAHDGAKLVIKNTGFTKGVLPSSYSTFNITYVDKDNTYMGTVQNYINNQGNSYLNLETYNYDKSKIAIMRLVSEANGKTYATAPTTPSNATSNEIATADWVNTKVAQRNKVTNVTSYTQLMDLIKNGKRGDSFGITMDYVGGSIGGIYATGRETHAFGHYTIDEITVSGGALTGLQAFGSGEVSGKLKNDDDTTYVYATTGFGRQAIGTGVFDAFRAAEGGVLTYFVPNGDNASISAFEGYYISI